MTVCVIPLLPLFSVSFARQGHMSVGFATVSPALDPWRERRGCLGSVTLPAILTDCQYCWWEHMSATLMGRTEISRTQRLGNRNSFHF